jgi:Leucine-rich repeat (LRR) protein
MALWWIFLLAYGFTNYAQSQPCPPTLPEECNCTEQIDAGLDIRCEGYDIVNSTQQLPPNTEVFHYVALEMFVQLAATNFSHVPNLKVLKITDPQDENVLSRKIYSMSSNDKIFQGLDKLQTLAINVNWKMTTRLPGIFMGLPSLETLDLSNTRFMNIDNLIDSLQGLRNNTKLTALNLWNIKTLEYSSTNLEFDLGKVLEPLSGSKLEVLNIGYNAFRSVRPGILQYAPHLKQIIVKNNALIPIITSSLMTEVFLHKTLEEADFSEQGFRPATDDASSTMVQPHSAHILPTSSPLIQLYSDLIIPERFNQTHLESVGERTAVKTRSDPYDFIPMPPSVIAFLKKYITCFIMLYDDTCNILEVECLPVKQILSEDHALFCAILNVFFKWDFSGIPCDYLPPFDVLISPKCGACLVIPSLGSLKMLKLSGLNVYDYVNELRDYRRRPLCFYPNNSIEYIDLSRNDAHGYPQLYRGFYTNIRGLEYLTFLNCSRNALDMPYTNITSNFPNLKTIDASRNKLVLADERFIHVAESGEVILLSHNRIGHIARDKFARLYNLKVLDLSYNSIQELDISLSNSATLEYLDLRGNSLISLHQFTIDQLNEISRSNSSHTLRIHLGNNRLICACSTRGFVAWVLHSHPPNILFEDMDEYVCANRYSDLVSLHKVSMHALHFECYENIGFGCVGAVCMVVLLALVLAYN